MINNLVITCMQKEGIDIYKSAEDITDKDLIEAICTRTYKNDAKLGDLTHIEFNNKQIYSGVFTYKDDPDARDNLYNLHVIAEEKIVGMYGMIKGLANQFYKLGLHTLTKDELSMILFAISNHAESVDISGIEDRVYLTWSDKDKENLELWQ